MSHRSPARFLAPLALLAAFATIYLVVHAGLPQSSSGKGASQGTSSATGTTPKATKGKSKSARAKRKTYTVKSGDVLGTIATRTGVPVETLLSANGLDASQPLHVGQKLKLAP